MSFKSEEDYNANETVQEIHNGFAIKTIFLPDVRDGLCPFVEFGEFSLVSSSLLEM